ncbi:hypothetical protein GCM10010302_29590 [Streptomyces polychromogenes]|uniref:DUF4232 domain-containing protein n=1 Tax=Streptomyces polychromogenes TaxID=67342 RepID=A0ABP3F102_9ACTN
MSGNRRKAFLVSAALLGGAVLLTACQDSGAATDTGARGGASTAPSPSAPAGGKQADGKGSAAPGKPSAGTAGSGADTGSGGRKPVGQSCGAGDIAWSARSESQAGGYILITAKAKPGITCYLPPALPTVAFGSDGTQAGPAEQAAGKQIQLSGNTAAYAGVNPKTTKGNGGKELDSIIVAVGDSDPDPVSLQVGTITVDHPVVTHWRTRPEDAVPAR